MKKLLYVALALTSILAINPNALATPITFDAGTQSSALTAQGSGNGTGWYEDANSNLMQGSVVKDSLIPFSDTAYSVSTAPAGSGFGLLAPASVDPLVLNLEGGASDAGNEYFALADDQRQADQGNGAASTISETAGSSSLVLLGAAFLFLAVSLSRKVKPSQVALGA